MPETLAEGKWLATLPEIPFAIAPMPASRTRKKATQKKAMQHRQREQQARHQAFKKSFGSLELASMLYGVPACADCGAERMELTPEQVPADTWEKMAPMREAMESDGAPIAQIAYCASCNQYSVLSDWESD